MQVLNRSQVLVLSFFGGAVIALLAILIAAPGIYMKALTVPAGTPPLLLGVSLALLVALISLLGVGVLRRWRWMFWVIVIAFIAGLLRVPASILELAGLLPTAGPTWYVAFQALVGVIQFAIGLALLKGYRSHGVWGAF